MKLVIGSTGFIGRALVKALVERYPGQVRALVRQNSKLLELAQLPGLELVVGDILDRESLTNAMKGVDTLFYFAALTANIKNKENIYWRINAEGTYNAIEAAAQAGVKRLVLCNGLGTIKSTPGSYMRTRWEMEEAARQSNIPWTILQPGVVFGTGSEFFESQARIIKKAPIAAMIGGSKIRFQPVFVGDVVRAAVEASERNDKIGKTIELVGTENYTYKELIDLILVTIKKKRLKVSVPLWAAGLGATIFNLLPKPPLTPALVEMFSFDNIAADPNVIEHEFGFKPSPLIPYLEKHGIRF
jgi:NADH dehydrogenase